MTTGTIARRSWTGLYHFLFPDSTFPPRKHETDIAGFLFERGYHEQAIRVVLDHIDGHGSVECCQVRWFDLSDKAHVEELIPDAPIGCWGQYPGQWITHGSMDRIDWQAY